VPEISIRYRKMHRCHVDRRTHKRWRHTSVCARSRRVEESSKTCSSPNARAIFTHTWTCLHLLPRTQRRSGYPCDGACSARASRLSMFSQRGSEQTSSIFPLNFRYIALYTPFNNLRKSTLVIVHNLQKIIV